VIGGGLPGIDPLFAREYRSELAAWLYRRLRLLVILYVALNVLAAGYGTLMLLTRDGVTGDTRTGVIVGIANGAVLSLIALWFLRVARERAPDHAGILRLTRSLILITGGLSVVAQYILTIIGLPGAPPAVDVIFWHAIPCLLLPWTPRDSLVAIGPVYLLWAIMQLILPGIPIGAAITAILLVPLGFLPGLLVAHLRLRRHGRAFNVRMIGRSFYDMRRELDQARRVHEAMLPAPITEGPVTFDFLFRPMKQMGGDFLHAAEGPDGRLLVTMLDVTGHGLTAALAVNRIAGELDRLEAEDPSILPGDLLHRLNTYMRLTLARHGVYASAVTLAVDHHARRVSWANAGHPPALLRRGTGETMDFAATEPLLGAMEAEEFGHQTESIDMLPGDAILLYTDGLFECRGRCGTMFGLAGIRKAMLAAPDPRTAHHFLMQEVDRFAGDLAEDDRLAALIHVKDSDASR